MNKLTGSYCGKDQKSLSEIIESHHGSDQRNLSELVESYYNKDHEDLLDLLEDYSESDIYPLHMPGHKRRLAPGQLESVCRMDITEIDGFDNLHDAQGILKDAQEFAARLYGSDETAFLVNGSSSGILAAISSQCRSGGKILVSRACHKSVYHAIEILQLEPVYIYPHINSRYGIAEGISGEEVRKALELNSSAQAVVLTSPTYDGVMSDIKGICAAAHEKNIPVIIDEAHGAHLRFSEYFPESAVDAGADIVIQSTHKTLPAMTQTAIIHMNGMIADRKRLRRMLTVFQSSSPSYILMGSIDGCMRMLADHGDELYDRYTLNLSRLRKALSEMDNLHLLEQDDLEYYGSRGLDRSKILVTTSGTALSGADLYYILLNDFHIQLEMMAPDYVLGMTSAGDDEEGLMRTAQAFIEADKRAGACTEGDGNIDEENSERPFSLKGFPRPEAAVKICEASWSDREDIALNDASGRISAEYIYLYPPGIPVITPGELFDDDVISIIKYWRDRGMQVKGAAGGRISALKRAY